MSNYRKLLAASAGVFGVLSAVLADGSVSLDEGGSLAAAVIAAYGVYKLKNVPA